MSDNDEDDAEYLHQESSLQGEVIDEDEENGLESSSGLETRGNEGEESED